MGGNKKVFRKQYRYVYRLSFNTWLDPFTIQVVDIEVGSRAEAISTYHLLRAEKGIKNVYGFVRL